MPSWLLKINYHIRLKVNKMTDTTTAWDMLPPVRCKNGHVIGRVLVDVNRISRLYVKVPGGVLIVAGDAVVPCPICNKSRVWCSGVRSIKKLLNAAERNCRNS